MADFDGLIQPSADWVDVPSLSATALALGGTSGAGVMNAQATALTKRTNYLYNYTIQYDPNTGYVGVNVPSPSVQMEVANLSGQSYSPTSTISASPNSTFQISQNVNSNNTQSLQSFYTKYGGGLWFMGTVANGSYTAPFVFGARTGSTSYSEVARFDANFNFGLGTTTPFNISGYKIMDVRGSSGAFYYGGNSASSKTFRVGYSAVNDALELNAISSNSIWLKTFDTTRVAIDANGIVGVGTTTTSGGTGNTTVEGKMIVYQSSANVPSITIPFPGSNYAGFKIVHQSTNTAGASDYTDFRIRPSYSTGIASGVDQTFLRVVNTFPRTFADVNINPDGGNLGLGVVPSTWTAYRGLEIAYAGNAIYSGSGTEIGMTSNAVYNSGWKYATTGTATRYVNGGGVHLWQTASSGTAGSAITFTDALKIDNTGKVGIKTFSPTATLDVNGSINTNSTLQVASYAVVGTLVANDPGSTYYGYTNRIGGTVGISSALGINIPSASLSSTLQVGGDVKANSSKGFIFGSQFKNLKASSNGTSAIINISADALVVENSSNFDCVVLRSISTTCSTAVTGLGGLDTGTITTNTWYSLWIIYNPTTSTVGTLLSLSSTIPTTFPSGYTHAARVGWIRTDATSNKYPLSFKQYGKRVQYVVAAGSNLTSIPVISSGTQGSPTTPTYIAVSTTSVTPSTAQSIGVTLRCGANTVIAAPNPSYGPVSSTSNPPPLALSGSAFQGQTSAFILLESTNVYWASDNTNGVLACFGWEDNL